MPTSAVTTFSPRPLPLFALGRLKDLEFTAQLLERPIEGEDATLQGFRMVRLDEASHYVLMEDPDATVESIVLRGLTAADFERLDAYGGVGEGLYERRHGTVVVQGESEPACFYLPTAKTWRRYR